jgi:hypothetical protein
MPRKWEMPSAQDVFEKGAGGKEKKEKEKKMISNKTAGGKCCHQFLSSRVYERDGWLYYYYYYYYYYRSDYIGKAVPKFSAQRTHNLVGPPFEGFNTKEAGPPHAKLCLKLARSWSSWAAPAGI